MDSFCTIITLISYVYSIKQISVQVHGVNSSFIFFKASLLIKFYYFHKRNF